MVDPYCSLTVAVVAQTFLLLGVRSFAVGNPDPHAARFAPPFTEIEPFNDQVLVNPMMNNASFSRRLTLVRPGLTRARRARARIRRQRLLMFKTVRSN